MATSSRTQPSAILPVRGLSLLDAVMVLCGNTIGSAIFLTAGAVASAVPNAAAFLAAWILGAALSFAGALTFAELGSRLPFSGGQYIFLRYAYGPRIGFLFGWTSLLVYQSGGLAAVAVGCAKFLSTFVPSLYLDRTLYVVPYIRFLHISGTGILAAFIIVSLSALQCWKMRFTLTVQNIFEISKLTGIIALIVGGLIYSSTVHAGQIQWFSTWKGSSLSAFWGTGMIAVLWTFDGWDRGTWLAGEIRDPERNVPRCMTIGTGLVAAVYLGANFTYLKTLSFSGLASSKNAAADTALRLFGTLGQRLVLSLIVFSLLGCLHAVIMTGPRLYHQMAEDGLFFQFVRQLHPVSRIPIWGILLQTIWASLLVLSGTYEQLVSYVTFPTLGLYVLTGIGLIIIRRKVKTDTQTDNLYRVPWYPVTPILFVASCLWIMANTFYQSRAESVIGLALVAAGLVSYQIWQHAASRQTAAV